MMTQQFTCFKTHKFFKNLKDFLNLNSHTWVEAVNSSVSYQWKHINSIVDGHNEIGPTLKSVAAMYRNVKGVNWIWSSVYWFLICAPAVFTSWPQLFLPSALFLFFLFTRRGRQLERRAAWAGSLQTGTHHVRAPLPETGTVSNQLRHIKWNNPTW